MVDDPNRKSPRSFQCRDALWDALEALAAENEQSVDYLINEAVRTYLQAQGRSVFAPRHTMPPMTTTAPKAPMSQGMGGGGMPAAGPPSGPRVPSIPKMPPMPTGGGGPRPPSMPGMAAPPMPAMGRAPGPPPMAKPAGPPPMPPGGAARAPAPPPMPARAPQLFAVFEGSEYVVDKEEFFIGRGQKVCDIVIRDTNVSRQHAKVMKHNGAWWMLDNQSLNGVEFRGAKLQQKRIDDGDTFTVCGHPIQFSYR